MMPIRSKLFAVTPPAAIVDNAAVTTNVIDTKGFRFCRIVMFLGATDIAVAAAKVQEADAASDATTLTSASDVVGTRYGTDADDTGTTAAVPSATDDNKFFTWEIDLRGRKRYLKPVVTGGDGSTGAFFCIFAELHNGEITPTTAAQKGVARNLRAPVIS